MNDAQNITITIILYIPSRPLALLSQIPNSPHQPRSHHQAQWTEAQPCCLFKTPRQPPPPPPWEDSTNGRPRTAAKGKGPVPGIEGSGGNERAEEEGGKILTLQNMKSPNQVLTRLSGRCGH